MEALPCYTADKNIRLFETHRVLSAVELRSRRDIGLDSYAKLTAIEARTMIMMTRRQILPAVIRFSGDIAAASGNIRNTGVDFASGEELLSELCSAADVLSRDLQTLEAAMAKAPDESDALEEARYMRDEVMPAMANLRRTADQLEQLTDRSYWPFPTYDQLLFSV